MLHCRLTGRRGLLVGSREISEVGLANLILQVRVVLWVTLWTDR